MSCEVACRPIEHFTNRCCGESRRFGAFARPAFRAGRMAGPPAAARRYQAKL